MHRMSCQADCRDILIPVTVSVIIAQVSTEVCLVIYVLETFSCASTTTVKQKRVGKCGSPDDLARECDNTFCFNCDTTGHTAKDCTQDMRCCICKSTEHRAIDCPFSWYRRPTTYQSDPPSEDNRAREDPDLETNPDPPGDPPTPPAAGDVNLERVKLIFL